MAIPTKEEMKARFWNLTGKMDAARAKIAPLRAKRDAMVNRHREEDEKAMAEIRKIEAAVEPDLNMFDAQQELAFLARGLGNVGERPTQDA